MVEYIFNLNIYTQKRSLTLTHLKDEVKSLSKHE